MNSINEVAEKIYTEHYGHVDDKRCGTRLEMMAALIRRLKTAVPIVRDYENGYTESHLLISSGRRRYYRISARPDGVVTAIYTRSRSYEL